jgi:hypothetical protein
MLRRARYPAPGATKAGRNGMTFAARLAALTLLAALLPGTARAVLAEITAVVGFWAAAAVVVFTMLLPFARVRDRR